MSARWPLAAFVAMGAFWGTWAALLPDIKEQVGASDGELGLAMVGAGLGSLPAMLLTGRLWRRYGWWLVPVTAIAFALSTLALLLAGTPLALGVVLVCVGAASGSLDVAMNSAVSDVEMAQHRRLMYGAHALFSLAVLVASVSTGLAREGGVGAPVALSVAAFAFVLVAAGASGPARAIGRHGETGNASAQLTATKALQLLGLLAVLCGLAFLIEDAIQNWSALLLERELATSPAIGGAGPGVFGGAMFLGRSAGQWLGGRFSDRVLLTTGALAAAAGLVVAATATQPAIALVGLGLGGSGVALVAPALFGRAGRLAGPRSRGAAIAAMTTVGYLGFVVGPVVMGLVAQALGLRTAFGVMAGLALLLSAVGLVVLRTPAQGDDFASSEELLRTGRA